MMEFQPCLWARGHRRSKRPFSPGDSLILPPPWTSQATIQEFPNFARSLPLKDDANLVNRPAYCQQAVPRRMVPIFVAQPVRAMRPHRPNAMACFASCWPNQLAQPERAWLLTCTPLKRAPDASEGLPVDRKPLLLG